MVFKVIRTDEERDGRRYYVRFMMNCTKCSIFIIQNHTYMIGDHTNLEEVKILHLQCPECEEWIKHSVRLDYKMIRTENENPSVGKVELKIDGCICR